MKFIKITCLKKIENEFLLNCMIIYIERESPDNIDLDEIIDEFSFLKNPGYNFVDSVFLIYLVLL